MSPDDRDLPATAGHQRVALVSGANKGLGLETARQLAAAGVAVFLGSRDPDAGRRAARTITSGAVEVVQLDVTDQQSIAAATAAVEAAGRGLDIVVNNAGKLVPVTSLETTGAVMADVFATNVFGALDLTRACLPLLARSSAARVVNVSSGLGSMTLTSEGHEFGGDPTTRLAYASSKAALNMVTLQLAATLREDAALAHVTVNSVNPGFTATDATQGEGRDVAEGARVVVDMALAGPGGPSGGFFDDAGPVAW